MHRSDVVVRYTVVLAGAAVGIGGMTVLGLVLAGATFTGSLVHGAGLALIGLTFTALGLLTAQLAPSTTAAREFAAVVLGIALVLRVAGDAGAGLEWLRWLTPFGLVTNSAPFAANTVLPLAAGVPAVLTLVALAAFVADRRDLGAGLLRRHRSRRAPRRWLLGSAMAFAVFRSVRPCLMWTFAVSSFAMFLGGVSGSVIDFLAAQPRFAALAADAGFSGLDTISGFAAVIFSVLAVVAGFYAVSRMKAVATAEFTGRAVHLFALPLTRRRLVLAEVVVGASGIVLMLSTAAAAMWCGTFIAGEHLPLPETVAGALNVAPVSVLSLAAATLALGGLPRLVSLIGAVPTVGGFVLAAAAPSLGLPGWLAALSPFTYLTPVPQAPADWTALTVFSVTAAILVTLGAVAYERRDLAC
ncbi:hypothetical protein BAY61_20555 [Prauserella marina]|uniref:ABC-2 type transport system permease protein n=1 Tax=Prauserella marina TaxID=530584 RepID=A0A222VSQ4_9PSEU|nr:hypothetical protein [Prauserella marina]ASR36975.1 hypothetical protein BAY61_20555 [Prauserella marina]PWV80061.1 ABC-2 type transport system permease protein [Prauserella marina]SDD84049.1 ABC-2 type transport system permease protein [Prauserella marina]